MPGMGRLSYVLSVQSGQFERGLDQAANRLNKLAKGAATPFSALETVLTAPMKAIQSFLGPVQSLLTSIPFIGGALAAVPLTGAGFFSWISSGLQQVKETTREADRLGVSTQAMAGIMALGGADSEALTMGLLHLQRELGAAAEGSEETRQKFTRLGLDWKEMARSPLDQALGKLGDRMKQLDSVAKGRFLQETLGRGGQMAKGAVERAAEGGVDKATAKAMEQGLGFTAEQAAQAGQASAAIKDLEKSLKGLQTQAAIEVAPTITVLLRMFAAPGNAKEAGTAIGEVFNTASKGIAMGADIWKAGGIVGKLFAGRTSSALEDLLQLTGGESTVEKLQRAQTQAAHDAQVAGSKETKTAELHEDNLKTVDELTRKLHEQMDTYGMTGHAAEIYKASVKIAGDTAAESALATLKAEAQALDGLEELGKTAVHTGNLFADYANDIQRTNSYLAKFPALTEAGRGALEKLGKEFEKAIDQAGTKAIEESMSGLDKFQNRYSELQELLKRGKLGEGAAGEKVFALEVQKAFQGLGTARQEPAKPGAYVFGSTEAYSAIEKARTHRETTQEQIQRILQEQRELQRQQLRAAEDLVQQLRSGQMPPITQVSLS